MASKFAGHPDGTIDTSWGLIYRLNKLWGDIDYYAARGDFENWNSRLDRVFCNLLFKEDLVLEKTENGEIVSVELSEDDQEVFDYLNKEYKSANEEYKNAKTKQEMIKAKEKVYHALMLKDIGLRKLMRELKLYLKEADPNPARSMWGV